MSIYLLWNSCTKAALCLWIGFDFFCGRNICFLRWGFPEPPYRTYPMPGISDSESLPISWILTFFSWVFLTTSLMSRLRKLINLKSYIWQQMWQGFSGSWVFLFYLNKNFCNDLLYYNMLDKFEKNRKCFQFAITETNRCKLKLRLKC